MAEELIASIGGALLDGLIGLVAGFVKDLVGGAIRDLIRGELDVANLFEDAWEGVLRDVDNMIGNALGSIESVATTSINAGADALREVLGVVDAQTELINSLQYGAEHYFDDLVEHEKEEQRMRSETGAALSDFAFRLMSEHSDMLQTAGETFYGSLEAGISEERFGTTNYSAAMLGKVQQWLAADLRMVENLTMKESEAAALMVIEIAKADARFVEEWFLETVAKPISYGSNMEWALRTATQMDPETYKEQLLGMMRSTWEVYQEMLEKGYVPPG